MSDSDRRCWNIAEFCQAHRIGRTKFYAEVKAGRLPIVKIGHRTLIRIEDGEDWLRCHLVGGKLHER